MIVVDASAAVLGLLDDGDARSLLATESMACPHLADSEIAHTLRSHVLRRVLDEADAERALDRWAHLAITRFGISGLLGRVWELRGNLSGYDATYVAVAEALECQLLTADGRLARAPGPRCPITVVRT